MMVTVRLSYDPTEEQLGQAGYFKWFENEKGLKLASYFWPVEKPKCLVYLIHGHGIHTEFTYLKAAGDGKPSVYKGSWVESLNKKGFSVCGLDSQSCGRSEGLHGLRCYFDSFDDVVNDSVQFLKSVKTADDKRFANLPTFLLGGSAGGCAAVHVAHKHPNVCDGVVLLAPMLSLEKLSNKGINYYLRPLADAISYWFPTAQLAATNKNEMFPDIQNHYDMDPGCWHGSTRIRVAAEFLKASEWVMREMDKMEFPFLCIHSKDDTLCDLEGSKTLERKSLSQDKTLIIVKDMWHVLVAEPGWEAILESVLEWVDKRAMNPSHSK